MPTYAPEQFSEIHHWPEVPDKVGYYVAGMKWYVEELHKRPLNINSHNAHADIWYFDGRHWRDKDGGFICHFQERSWFGLKEKP